MGKSSLVDGTFPRKDGGFSWAMSVSFRGGVSRLAALQESHPQFPAWAKAWRLLSTWKRSNCSLAKSIGIGPKDGFYSKASRILKHDLILVLAKYNHIIFTSWMYIWYIYIIYIYIIFPLKNAYTHRKIMASLGFLRPFHICFSKKSPGTPLL